MRKAKRKGQRVLAAALCVGMLASMVPAQAFANDEPITAIVQQEDTPADADAPAEDTDAGQTPAPTEAPAEETPAPTEAPGEETPAPAETPAEEAPTPTEAPEKENAAMPEEAAQEEADAAPAEESQIAVQASTAVNYIATYQGEIPTVENVEWPAEVSQWDFMDLYSQVTLTSTAGDTYVVEVIPQDTVYFIDSGTGTDWKATVMKGSKDASAARNLISKPYEAVSTLVGGSLLNKVSDQAYTSGQTWGVGYTAATKSTDRADPIQSYWNNNVAPTDGSDITNKYAAGLRASNATNFEYYLTLDAGTYTLVSGFHEFYNGNHNRGMTPKIYDAASNTLLATFDAVSMSNNGNSSAAPNVMNSGTFKRPAVRMAP